MSQENNRVPVQAITPEQLKQICEMAETIRYGSISLVFQDGKLIQIERNEKIRMI